MWCERRFPLPCIDLSLPFLDLPLLFIDLSLPFLDRSLPFLGLSGMKGETAYFGVFLPHLPVSAQQRSFLCPSLRLPLAAVNTCSSGPFAEEARATLPFH